MPGNCSEPLAIDKEQGFRFVPHGTGAPLTLRNVPAGWSHQPSAGHRDILGRISSRGAGVPFATLTFTQRRPTTPSLLLFAKFSPVNLAAKFVLQGLCCKVYKENYLWQDMTLNPRSGLKITNYAFFSVAEKEDVCPTAGGRGAGLRLSTKPFFFA